MISGSEKTGGQAGSAVSVQRRLHFKRRRELVHPLHGSLACIKEPVGVNFSTHHARLFGAQRGVDGPFIGLVPTCFGGHHDQQRFAVIQAFSPLMSQLLHHFRIVLADREVVQPGRVAQLPLVEGRTVAGFPEFEPFEQTRSNDTVHLRTKLGDDKGGVVFTRTFLVERSASKLGGQEQMSGLTSNSCALHQAHPHCARSSLARICASWTSTSNPSASTMAPWSSTMLRPETVMLRPSICSRTS